MAAIQQNMKALVSVSILEKDKNGDVLQTWCYPEVSKELEGVLKARSGLERENIIQFSFSKYKTDWVYIFVQTQANSQDDTLSNCVVFGICLITTDFNPEKYVEMTKLMSTLYQNTGSPVSLLQCYLSIFSKGSFRSEQGQFKASEHDPRKAFLATPIKDVIKLFGEESILLWAALIMKKRIVVLSERLGILLKIMRAIPIMVWHRQNWDILRPYMTMSEVELADIQAAGVYCAGFTDEAIRDKEELYDLVVDVNNRSISVASHAKADFMMTPVHKDICNFLVSSSEDPEKSDQEIIKGLVMKTKDVLTKLESLKVEQEDGSSYIDYETLQNTKLPAHMDRFLYAMAVAEGMTKI